jgi:hypothetical protein
MATKKLTHLICLSLTLLAVNRCFSLNGQMAAAAPPSPVGSNARVSYGVLWTDSSDYSSALILQNKSGEQASTTVQVFSENGQLVTTRQVQISPNSSSKMLMSDLIANSPITVGGLSVQWNDPAQSVSGRIEIADGIGNSASYPLRAGYHYDSDNSLSAPWWLPDPVAKGDISLFNSSSETITVTPSLIVGGSEKGLDPILITAKSRKSLSLHAILAQTGFQGARLGSLTLRYTGPAHALQPALLLFNVATGFILNPDFSATHDQVQMQQTTSLQFPYVSLAMDRIGGTSNIPDELALVSNGSNSPIEPTITAYTVNGGNVQKVPVSIPPLGANETRLVDLSQVLQQLPAPVTRVALTVSHSGQPGDLRVSIFGMNQSEQVVTRSEGMVMNVDADRISYWDASKKQALTYQIKSTTGTSASGRAMLIYQTSNGTSSYVLPSTLSVDDDKGKPLNLTQIIRSGSTDENGSRLPQGVTSGLLVLSDTAISDENGTLASCSSSCTGQEKVETSQGAPTTSSPIAFANNIVAQPLCGTGNACFADLFYRPVIKFGIMVANHAFWQISTPSTANYVLDGGPQNSNCLPNCGFLEAWSVMGNIGFETGDNTATSSVWWYSGFGTQNCLGGSLMQLFVSSWNQSGTTYAPLGPNSNSMAHYLTTAGGFSASAPPDTTGW